MRKLFAFASACLTISLLAGCAAMPVSTAPSTKPLNQNGYTTLGKAKGRAVGIYILGIIPISEPYPARISVDRAVASGGGDALIDLTTDTMALPIPLLYITISTTQGTAVQSKQSVSDR